MADPGFKNRKSEFFVCVFAVLLALAFGAQWWYVHSESNRVAGWWVSVLLLVLSGMAIGLGQANRIDGILIDERMRISLSRFQIALWTAVLLPTISLSVISRLSPIGGDDSKASENPTHNAAVIRAKADEKVAQERATAAHASADGLRKAADAKKLEADRLVAETGVARAAAAAAQSSAAAAGASPELQKAAVDLARAVEAAAAKSTQAALSLQQAEQQAKQAEGTAAAADAQVQVAQDTVTKAENAPIDPFPAIPGELLVLMGISLTTAVATPLLVKPKSEAVATVTTFERAVARSEAAGQPVPVPYGLLAGRAHPSEARWSDLFEGEELGTVGTVDISRLQNLYFTVVLVVPYAATLHQLFASDTIILALPGLSTGAISLLGISHAGYLSAKAMPRTPQDPVGAGVRI